MGNAKLPLFGWHLSHCIWTMTDLYFVANKKLLWWMFERNRFDTGPQILLHTGVERKTINLVTESCKSHVE